MCKSHLRLMYLFFFSWWSENWLNQRSRCIRETKAGQSFRLRAGLRQEERNCVKLNSTILVLSLSLSLGDQGFAIQTCLGQRRSNRRRRLRSRHFRRTSPLTSQLAYRYVTIREYLSFRSASVRSFRRPRYTRGDDLRRAAPSIVSTFSSITMPTA